MGSLPQTTLQVHSAITDAGTIRVSLAEAPIADPDEDELLIAVEAAPINPSDIAFLLAGAAPSDLRFSGKAREREVSGPLSRAALRAAEARIGLSLRVGLEGAGRVVAAGRSGEHLVGKRVSALCLSLGMYSQYSTVKLGDCLPLKDEHTARDGADAFCNPLTALVIVETLHQTGHSALVHTAAASSLGQMLVRICQEDGIKLVNIVRRQEQVDLLKRMGATHVCNSSAPEFREDLLTALRSTGAMVAFDAIGGGSLASELLAAMETVAAERSGQFHPFGTSMDKRVYVYGRLDPGPTVIGKGNYGMVWGVDGWAMPPILERAGPERAGTLMQRVTDNLTSTFASRYVREISLPQLLQSEILLDYCRQATGSKYLLNPQLPIN